MSMYAKHQVSPAKAAVVEEMKEKFKEQGSLEELFLEITED